MKILIDENLPKQLKLDFREHEIFTVSDKGWQSKRNGELLELMLKEKFDILFTFDQNLQHQQNFEKYPIAVFILIATDNRYLSIQKFIASIQNQILKGIRSGVFIFK